MKSIKLFLFVLIMLTAFCSCRKSDSTNKESKIFYGVDHTNEFTTEELTFIINGQKISSDFFEIQIPDGFSASQDGNSLIIENKSISFDVSIEEHKYINDDFEHYLSRTIEEYRLIGAEVSSPKSVTIGDYNMQRVKVKSSPIYAYAYFIDQSDKAVLISMISNSHNHIDDEVDTMLENINLSLYWKIHYWFNMDI